MVYWHLQLNDDTSVKGSSEDGSWKRIPDSVKAKVVGMKIYNDQAGATIDKNCSGYFFGRKIIADIKTGQQQEYVGIGYWKKHEKVARVKWYNAKTMELLKVQVKPLSKCGFCLIKVGDQVECHT